MRINLFFVVFLLVMRIKMSVEFEWKRERDRGRGREEDKNAILADAYANLVQL